MPSLNRPKNCFNPRPPRKVGATRIPGAASLGRRVSILAHPERWALRRSSRARSVLCGFQSSPTPKGGRYAPINFDVHAYQSVSILAHPERWALLRQSFMLSPLYPVSILAHPERWALRDNARLKVAVCRFQSSPTPKGGRYAAAFALQVFHFLFQSSPTPKGGRYWESFAVCHGQ